MEGLGREHIDRKRHVPPPTGPVKLGDAIADVFGAKISEGPEPVVYRPNRAERRAAGQRGRRRG